MVVYTFFFSECWTFGAPGRRLGLLRLQELTFQGQLLKKKQLGLLETTAIEILGNLRRQKSILDLLIDSW